MALAAGASAQSGHPLDPLSAAEIETAARALQRAPGFPADALFSTIVLNEPSKESILAWRPGDPFRREAFAIVMDRPRTRTYEGVVGLRDSSVRSWREIPGVQPQVFVVEYNIVPLIVKADPRWQEAMRRPAVPVGLLLISRWARARPPGDVRARTLEREPDDTERD